MRLRKAVGAFIVNSERKFLLLKRRDQTGFMYWDIMRGGIEKGERPLQALKRELKEELGIDGIGKTKRLSLSFSFEFPGRLKKIVGFDKQNVELFFVELGKEKIKIDKKEILGFEFVDKREFLKKATFETARKAFEKMNKKLRL